MSALAPDDRFLLYTDRPPEAGAAGNVVWSRVAGSGVTWHGRVARASRECDVYFSTMTYVTPQLLRTPYVQTVYDLIPFKDFAQPQTPCRSSRAADAAASRSSRPAGGEHLTGHGGRTHRDRPGRCRQGHSYPLGADERFRAGRDPGELAVVRARYDLPDAFILTTGTIEPRKNHLRLLQAHRALPKGVRAANPLILAGRKGWAWKPVLAAVQKEGPELVRHLDFVPDDDLAPLYSAANLFCYPSLHEGFGLPVLEAIQAGTPVVTSAVPSLREVGGDAVRYVDPFDVEGLSDVIAELLADDRERARLKEAGARRARSFSWEKTASMTLDVLRSAVA